MRFERYAIYDLGPQDLADFGADWLGWDARTGRETAGEGGALADTPRRYGFHATVKAPFRLAEGCSRDELAQALDGLAADTPVIEAPALQLRLLGDFLALVFDPQPQAVTDLAAKVVRDLDGFRAPLTDAERARRKPDRLSAPQRANLDRWGYPHVMDEFRFHMTLTGEVSGGAANEARQRLDRRLRGLLSDPHRIEALWLMGEDGEGRFHALHRAALGA